MEKIAKKDHIITVLLALAALLSVSFLWRHNIALSGVLTVVAGLLLLSSTSKRVLLYMFMFGAFSGAAAEALAIHFGTWTYANPSFVGIPLWLPLLWGIATVVIVRVYLLIQKL